MSIQSLVQEKKLYTFGVIFSSLVRMERERANVLPAVLEIIEEKSAWRISRKIRQYLVGFMGLSVKDKVTEFIREDGKTSFRGEEMCPLPPVHVKDIELMEKAERCDLVLTVLGCHSISRRNIKLRFNPLDAQWKLPTAATSTGIKIWSTPMPHLILSRLCC